MASLVRSLIERDKIPPHEILVLVRVDTRGAFSTSLIEAFTAAGVPCSVDSAEQSPLDTPEGRQVLAILRLVANLNDHLSWRTILELRKNGVGKKALVALYDFARNSGQTFSSALSTVEHDPAQLPKFGSRLAAAVKEIQAILTQLTPLKAAEPSLEGLGQLIRSAIELTLGSANEGILASCARLAIETQADSVQSFLGSLEARNVDIDPEIAEGKVNILTMHKAKGLTATAVIIVAAEDEHIPGRQDKEPELGDERRLLYVSLTRAKQVLVLTYCSRRYGSQRMLGRTSGKAQRTLSRFLRDAPIKPLSGTAYVAALLTPRPGAA